MALTGLTGIQISNLNVSGIATFEQTVGIAGTLTYEDVTNVDSVGLVTARDGIKVSGGQVLVGSGTSLHSTGLDLGTGNITGHNLKSTGIITATSFVGSGANLTNLDASDLASGTVPTARLGSGTASSSTFLAGDSTYKTVTGTTINNNADNRVITGSGTANTLEGESTFTHDPSACDTSIIHNSNNPADLIVQNNSTGTGANARLTLQSGSNSNAGAMLGMITGSHAWYLQTPKNAGNLEFQKGGLKFRMDNSGDFLINDGNLKIGTSGHGIDFSATSNTSATGASTQSELFDDYEEGTWTPAPEMTYVSGTPTYHNRYGTYTKIGRQVFIQGYIHFNSISYGTTNQTFELTGLPFNAVSSGGGVAGVSGSTVWQQLEWVGASRSSYGTNDDVVLAPKVAGYNKVRFNTCSQIKYYVGELLCNAVHNNAALFKFNFTYLA